MKLRTLLLTITLTAGAPKALAAGVEASIKGFTLTSCAEGSQLCLKAHSTEAVQSRLKNLHALKQTRVEISSTTSSPKVILAQSGYLDIEESQLVLFNRNKLTLQEIAIDLKTLEIKTTEHTP